MNNFDNIAIWGLRILAALILLQTLFFKFTAAPESVYIFTQIGIEPWGRIGTGVLELIAAVLILVPKTTVLGALMAVFLMMGAIFFHLTKLNISVLGDGGQLFIYALLTFFSSLALVIIFRNELVQWLRGITRQTSQASNILH